MTQALLSRLTSLPMFRETGFLFRVIIGGALMGVANIIPGLSGGTMILATGLYERFVDAVADVTRLRFRLRSIMFLVVLGAAALIAILLSVGVIRWALTGHHMQTLALFIGLTLGGVPLVWNEMKPARAAGIAGAIGGFLAILAINVGLRQYMLSANFVFLFVGGVIGSAAMVLPGISGSLLLLILGLYTPITSGIDDFKIALQAGDLSAAWGPALHVLLPVGLGVLAGIAGLTNLLKAALDRWRNGTLGVLLGLLIGSIVPLNPFRDPIPDKDLFVQAASMSAIHVALVVLFVAIGFAMTWMVSRLGAETPADEGL